MKHSDITKDNFFKLLFNSKELNTYIFINQSYTLKQYTHIYPTTHMDQLKKSLKIKSASLKRLTKEYEKTRPCLVPILGRLKQLKQLQSTIQYSDLFNLPMAAQAPPPWRLLVV